MSLNPQSAEQLAHGASPHVDESRDGSGLACPDKFMRLPAVEELSGLKKSSIYAGVKAGTFPPPVQLSVRAVAWRESDLIRWAAARAVTTGQDKGSACLTPLPNQGR